MSPVETTGKTFGRYLVLGTVGQGTVGVVYKAHDPIIGRTVAVKVIRELPDLAPEQREGFKARFRAEAEVAGSLHHPHIVTLYDVGDDYLVMEFLEGQLLDSLAGKGRALDPTQALRFARELALAIDFAHSRGVVHREIRPANVMVLAAGQVKVMDFGVARPRLRASGMPPRASPFDAYAAPERLEGRRADARSDIYSLGVVVYEMLTGQTPAHAAHEPLLPPHYEAVLRKALARDPALRFASALEFVETLEGSRPAGDQVLASLVEPPNGSARTSPSESSEDSADVPPLAVPEAGDGRIDPPRLPARPRAAASRVAAGLAGALALVAVTAAWLAWPRPSAPTPAPPQLATDPPLPKAPAAPTPAPPPAAGGSLPASGALGALLVHSTPPGARVFVAGVERGATPLFIEQPIGRAIVRVEKSQYLPAARLAWVSRGRSVGLSIALQPESGPRHLVDVLSLPDAGELWIDGSVRGRTNAVDLELGRGFHVIEIRKPGFAPWVREVDVAAAVHRVIATLERQPGPVDEPARR